MSGSNLYYFSNALITSKQLQKYRNAQNRSKCTNAVIFNINLITQTAGVLLRLPQEVIAASIILFQRFIVIDAFDQTFHVQSTGEQDSLARFAAASTYIAAKQSFYPLAPRSIINVYSLMLSNESPLIYTKPSANGKTVAENHVSEGQYQAQRLQLFHDERSILQVLGFDTKVVLPYNLSFTYLQTLSVNGSELFGRVVAHLNASLLSLQMLHLTHQPNALAVAAIYLASRELNINLIDDEVPWWEVFDVTREELGFLILSLGSINGFIKSVT